MNHMKLTSLKLLINIKNELDYLNAIESTLALNEKKTFFYLNSYSFYLMNVDLKFRDVFLKADYLYVDGSSVVIAMKLLCNTIIEKVTFNHSFYNGIDRYLALKKVRLFLLGSTDERLKKAIENLNNNLNGIEVVGAHNGYFNTEKETSIILKMIEDSQPDILLVGLGMPIAELWIADNFNSLKVKCVFTVGNFFDLLSGEIKLAPNILFNSGLEWIYRILQEPFRLLPRYMKANSFFIWRLIKELVQTKFRKSNYE